MRNRLRAVSLALMIGLVANAVAGDGEPGLPKFYLDPATGDIDGKQAIAVYPVTYRNSRVDEFLAPFGFEVHLTPADDPDTELVHPCGEWFLAPRGRYRVWVEGGWLMSPYSALLLYPADAFKGRGLPGSVPVGDAGRVTLPADEPRHPNLELRLLNAGSHREGHLVRWELSRRKAANAVGEGLLMPAGLAIGGLWDRASGRYVALSRPFQVPPRKTVAVPLDRPSTTADLILQLRRPAATLTVEDDDYEVDLALVGGDGDLPADAVVRSATTVYGVWYGLPPGAVELRAETANHSLDPQRLELEPGRIEHLVGTLRPRPALDVELDLPTALESGPLALEVRRLPSGEVVDKWAPSRGTRSHRFQRLPSALLEVALETGIGSFTRKVDLTSGEDGYLGNR